MSVDPGSAKMIGVHPQSAKLSQVSFSVQFDLGAVVTMQVHVIDIGRHLQPKKHS